MRARECARVGSKAGGDRKRGLGGESSGAGRGGCGSQGRGSATCVRRRVWLGRGARVAGAGGGRRWDWGRGLRC